MEGNSTTPKNCVLTNFLCSGFLTDTMLNFAQEWVLHSISFNHPDESCKEETHVCGLFKAYLETIVNSLV